MGVGETKIVDLEEELKVVANNLKSLEVAEEGQSAGEDLQGADQESERQAEAGRGPRRVRREICHEAAEGGGQAGGRTGGRAGEVQGDHRGTGADLRRDVRILVMQFVVGILLCIWEFMESKKL